MSSTTSKPDVSGFFTLLAVSGALFFLFFYFYVFLRCYIPQGMTSLGRGFLVLKRKEVAAEKCFLTGGAVPVLHAPWQSGAVENPLGHLSRSCL